MTSWGYRKLVERSFGFKGLPEDWDARLNESLAPRGPDMLYELAVEAGLRRGDLVLDAGCRDGDHAIQLEERYACRAVGIDLVEGALRTGLAELEAGEQVAFVRGDLEQLPFSDGGFDHVWCRDVLEMVEDPRRVLSEFRRVLRPGGGVMLYVAFATSALEPAERARLFRALGIPAWGMNRGLVDEAIRALGFEILSEQDVSPEWIERQAEGDASGLLEDVRTIARMRRSRARLEPALGTEWYERLLAWAMWGPYLLLGKIQTVAWVLRTPSSKRHQAG